MRRVGTSPLFEAAVGKPWVICGVGRLDNQICPCSSQANQTLNKNCKEPQPSVRQVTSPEL